MQFAVMNIAENFGQSEQNFFNAFGVPCPAINRRGIRPALSKIFRVVTDNFKQHFARRVVIRICRRDSSGRAVASEQIGKCQTERGANRFRRASGVAMKQNFSATFRNGQRRRFVVVRRAMANKSFAGWFRLAARLGGDHIFKFCEVHG